jgi:hypothetical protein
MGRFLSRDPLGMSGSGPNLYWYGNEPLLFTDPTGKCAVCIDVPNPVTAIEDARVAPRKIPLIRCAIGSVTLGSAQRSL